jgi:ABC-type branched-subunit amino acid transport system substrate-binding protein
MEALSGPLAAEGKAEVQGAEAAVAVFNKRGGIDGHHIVLTSGDDAGDPTTAINLVTAQVDGGSPPNQVLAGTDGSETDAVTPILKTHKILSVEATARTKSANPVYAPYDFASNTSGLNADLALCAGLDKKGIKSVGLLLSNDALGSIDSAALDPCFAKDGIKVTTSTYPDTATSMVSELSSLKAANPQVLVVSGFGAGIGTAVTSRAQIGWHIATYLSLPASGSLTPGLVPAADLENVYLFQFSAGIYKSSLEETPEFKTFFDALVKVTGTDNLQLPVITYGATYDAIADVYMAAKQGHTDTTLGLTNALKHLKASDPPENVTFHPLQFTTTDHTEVPGTTGFQFILATTPTSDGIVGLAPGTTPSF